MGKLLVGTDEVKREYQADFWWNLVGACTSLWTISIYHSDGHAFKGEKEYILRGTMDNFLIAEKTTQGFNQKALMSGYFGKKNANRMVQEYTICHTNPEELKNYLALFVRPYYTRSNLLTDYDRSSIVVFQSRLIQEIQSIGEIFKSALTISVANQNQMIENVDYKIKIQHKESYEKLISINRKYSKDKDQDDMDKLNSLLNSGLSNESAIALTQLSKKTDEIESEIKAKSRSMENYNRAIQMNTFFTEFVTEVNKLILTTNDRLRSLALDNLSRCGQKSLGDHYKCLIETNKIEAQARINLYEKMALTMDATIKRYTNRAYSIKD